MKFVFANFTHCCQVQKSVLALNLLKHFSSKRLKASYVTKNSAPREAYLKLLTKSALKKKFKINKCSR